MTMTDRGVHPDLIDEQEAAPAEAAPAPPSTRRGRSARAPEAVTVSPPPAEVSQEGATAGASEAPESPSAEEAAPTAPAPPEWWAQVKDASDPKAALQTIMRNVPTDELMRDNTIAGIVGNLVRRGREREEAEKRELQKREMLVQNDFYGLGQLAAPEIRARAEQLAAAENSMPFMNGVTLFQKTLPQEVQAEVSGKSFGTGKGYAEGVAEYLDAIHQAALRHGLNDAVEKEIQRRKPALQKAWLGEVNGNAPVPELDGGRAPSSREITDEQVDRMSMAEYDAYFDDRGQPKPGVRVRLTRGIPLTRR